MKVHFSGCWTINVTARAPYFDPGIDGGPVRLEVQIGNAPPLPVGPDLALGEFWTFDAPAWTVTVESLNPVSNSPTPWIEAPVQVVSGESGVTISANDQDQAGPYDDLVLSCARCVARPPNPEFETWVSWGVTVDGGGPTGHGPVPPWSPLVQNLGAALALADVASLVQPELRSAVLDLAIKQLNAATALISGAMERAKGE